MDNMFFKGLSSELSKSANKPAQAYGFLAKAVRSIRRSPIASTSLAAAGGIGLATGAAEVKAKSDEEGRQRDRVRQILISRLSEGGQRA
jgi:hypothetical protein